MKKVLLYVMSFAMAVCAAIAGTVAYLTDTDEDVNVMTLGNVEIDQIEKEWEDDGTLGAFENGKPLYPYVGEFGWEIPTEEGNGYRKFTMNNVVDKYVTVKNTGKSDAYVRTVFAFEMGELTEAEFDNMIGISINSENGSEFKFPGAWNWSDGFFTEFEGKKYYVLSATHREPLKPEEETVPSLLQVYLSKDATNEIVEKLDDNGDGVFNILVVSQAIQTKGFESDVSTIALDDTFPAKVALDTGFGEATKINEEEVATWFSTLASGHYVVSTAEEFQNLLMTLKDGYDKELDNRKKVTVVLLDDIILDKSSKMMVTNSSGGHLLFYGVDATLDLNGYDIVAEADAVMDGKTIATALLMAQRSNLNIVGEGNIITKNQAIPVYGWSNSTLNIYGGTYITNAYLRNESVVYGNNDSTLINVYGGDYMQTPFGFNTNNSCKNVLIVLHEGVEFNDHKNHFEHDYNQGRIALAEGLKLEETEKDGVKSFKVVKE